MKDAGIRRRSPIATVGSLVIIAVAVVALFLTLRHGAENPATDDASIDADVVHVAAPVGGRIVQIAVVENALVRTGDLLFRIDPVPYRLAADQARADLALSEAALATQGRAISTQRSAVTLANDQIARASSNLALADRTVERLRPLAAKGYVPMQQLDQAETASRDAATSLVQAREQARGASGAVDTVAGSAATVQARRAALNITLHALSDTVVRAQHAGRVVGLTVLSGETVAPAQPLFTLVGSEQWFASANFRESELGHIAVGDCATVYSMIDRSRPIRGVVESVGSGVLDTERVNIPRSAPYVERSLNWVRVAQRFPVRVRLDRPPAPLVRLGASAVVEVRHGYACPSR